MSADGDPDDRHDRHTQDMTDTTPIKRLQKHSLTDETARSVANYQRPKWAGPHASSRVPVRDTGDGITVGSPVTTEASDGTPWAADVIMTFGAGGKSVTAVKRAYREAKARRVAQSKRSYR